MNRNKTATSIFLCLVFLATSPVYSKVLYVDINAGNDSITYQQNSESSPWATIGRAMWGNTDKYSPNSSEAARAGDTVTIGPGTYNQSFATNDRNRPILEPVNSGTDNNPIIFQAQYPAITASPSQRTIITSSTDGRGEGVIGVGDGSANFIVFDGFYIDERNVHTREDDAPVQVKASNNITIRRFVIEGLDAASQWGWISSTNHSNIRIEGANNVLIENCRLTGVLGSHHNTSSIMIYTSYNLTFQNNDISNCFTGIHVKGDANGNLQSGVTIRYNLIHNTANAVEFGHVASSNGNNYMYQNVIRDSANWTSTTAAITFRSYSSGFPSDIWIVNNTFYNFTDAAHGFFYFKPGNYDNINIQNNIGTNTTIVFGAEDRSDVSPIRSSHNAWNIYDTFARLSYSNYGFSTWQSTYSQGANSVVDVSPNFVDAANHDFRLSSNSPFLESAQYAGIDILDLDGDGSRNDPISLGAYVDDTVIIGANGTNSGSDSDIIADQPNEQIPGTPTSLHIVSDSI